jgi:hypothetical protein
VEAAATAVEVEEEDGVCMMLRWLVWLQHVNAPSGRDDLMALVHGAKDHGLDKGQAKDNDNDNDNEGGAMKDKGNYQGLGRQQQQGLLGVNDLLHLVWATHGRSLRLETAVEVNTPLLKVSNVAICHTLFVCLLCLS